MEEKNIIEKTKEVKKNAKELKKIYEEQIIFLRILMQNILSFLTLPISTRLVEDYHINYAMLVNQKVTVPDLYFADSAEQLKYVAWICDKIEEGKKVLRNYQIIISEIYRAMVDYLIIEDNEQQEEVKKLLADNRVKLKEIIENSAINIIYEVNDIIRDVVGKFYKTEEIDKRDIGICKSKYKSREYMKEVVDITIKKFPAILQQDISKVDNEYWEFGDILGSRFEDIEMELFK